MKKILLFTAFATLTSGVWAATFTSIVTGAYQTATTWSFVGMDADGVPDVDDDVIVAAGHTVTVQNIANTNRYCDDLTINATGKLILSFTLFVNGDYINNGQEGGTGSLSFKNTKNISGTGIFGLSVRFTFLGTRTILAGTTIIKGTSGTVRFLSGCSVTNNGSFTIAAMVDGTNVNFTNGATGTLILRIAGFMDLSGDVFDASAVGNTVQIIYTGSIPTTASGYHHLRISNTGVTQASATVVNGNFTVDASRAFNCNGFDLTVGGDLTGTGTLTFGANTLNLNGTALQTISCSGTKVLANLNVTNTVQVNFSAGIYTLSDGLTVTGGLLSIGGAVTFTMLSDAAKTAYIGQSTGTVSGNFTIQRFIDARPDGFSDMSSSITGADFTQWDDDLELLFVPYVPNTTEPSCYGYDESLWDFVAVENSSDGITAGFGYEVYLDNDGNTGTPFANTTLDLVGTPNMGDVPVGVTFDNDGYNLIGNPYASFIDFTTFRANAGVGMSTTFLYYDEGIADYNSGTLGDDIAPSQGFWIQATAAGTVNFHENNKTTSTSSTFRSADEPLLSLRVKSESTIFTSNTYFRFNDASTAAYEFDQDLTFLKVPSPKAPALYSISSDAKKLRINELNATEEMTIPINFKAGIDSEYSISLMNIESALIEGFNLIILEDKQTGVFYDLGSSDYYFVGNVNDKAERFVLHLSKKATVLLVEEISPITFINSAEGVFVKFNFDTNQHAVISVNNMLGQEISSAQYVEVTSQKIQVNIPESTGGIYLVSVIANGKTTSYKVFK